MGLVEGQSSRVRKTPRKKINLSNYAAAPKAEENKKPKMKTTDSRQFKDIKKGGRSRANRFTRFSTTWQVQSIRYNYPFLGYCYLCNGYGHKASYCRRNSKRSQHALSRNRNVICYEFHNHGHVAKYCRARFVKQEIKMISYTRKIQIHKHPMTRRNQRRRFGKGQILRKFGEGNLNKNIKNLCL